MTNTDSNWMDTITLVEKYDDVVKQLKELQDTAKALLDKTTYIGMGLASVDATELDPLIELLKSPGVSDEQTPTHK